MDNTIKDIETTGLIDDETTEIGEKEWYKVAGSNPAFDFLKEPEEDIYSPGDGRPYINFGHQLPK